MFIRRVCLELNLGLSDGSAALTLEWFELKVVGVEVWSLVTAEVVKEVVVMALILQELVEFLLSFLDICGHVFVLHGHVALVLVCEVSLRLIGEWASVAFLLDLMALLGSRCEIFDVLAANLTTECLFRNDCCGHL